MDVGVIGRGVIGLTTGITLLKNGHRVQILSDHSDEPLVSHVAAGFWSPYRVEPRERVLPWAKKTREILLELLSEAKSGVRAIPVTHFGYEHPRDIWWKSLVSDFRDLRSEELPSAFSVGSTYTTYLMESPIYMPYLCDRFTSRGGEFIDEHVSALLDLSGRFDAVVNCSGVGAFELCADDEVFPIRGQVIRAKRPQTLEPSVVQTDDSFVVCRSEDCIIGGVNFDGDWSLEPRDADREELLKRVVELCPELAEPEIIEDRVGLRPGRSTVRLEKDKTEDSLIVIHNYGHGGAGYTLSWGCAEEVSRMILE